MQRFHLFEFEDLPWFPATIRNLITDYLSYVANTFDFYRPLLPTLQRGLNATSNDTIIDLASGGGGGLVSIAEQLHNNNPNLSITLTDYYPNIPAFNSTVSLLPKVFLYHSEPVNALKVPDSLRGLRTQFLSLHHFRPKDAQTILQNAVDDRAPILIVEAQARDVAHLLRFALSPFLVLLLTPLIRPFKFRRIFFTYLFPLVPFFTLWDGLVSVLRTYTTEDLEEIVSRLNSSDSFQWKIEQNTQGPATLITVLGIPNESEAAS